MQIVVRQISGLGNQLFQYAAGRYFATRYGASMRLALDPPQRAHSHGSPRPFLLSQFRITAPHAFLNGWDFACLNGRNSLQPAVRALRQAVSVQVVLESIPQRFHFLPDLSLRNGVRRVYLVGYWQALAYPDAVADTLRAEFEFREPARGRNLEALKQISQCESPVSLHIRRGDYTLAVEGNLALPLEYSLGGIRHFQERLRNPTFFVFSDDIEYARQNLPRDLCAVFVDHNDALTAHEDLRLMSSCHHHIIANSSFSWWACWLNARPGKMVYAPRLWQRTPGSYYPELTPSDWTLATLD